MMQPVVRYSQNASNSNSADPRKPWPPQPEMAWLNVFARVPGSGDGTVEAGFTTVSQRDNEAVLPTDATADDRAAIRQQRVILTDASTGLSSLRNAVSQPLYVLLAMVGGAAGDRVRQRRRAAAGARGGARARDGDPPVDGRGPRPPGAADARREPAARRWPAGSSASSSPSGPATRSSR